MTYQIKLQVQYLDEETGFWTLKDEFIQELNKKHIQKSFLWKKYEKIEYTPCQNSLIECRKKAKKVAEKLISEGLKNVIIVNYWFLEDLTFGSEWVRENIIWRNGAWKKESYE